jgi:ubiquinone/menaquinone biosynthesis C-methylase UbiE
MKHQDIVVDQFTRQAEAFSTAPVLTNEVALNVLVELAGAGPTDTLLDVACGPGLVVCAFAKVVRQATGVDLTPAMIDRARGLQQQKRLTNVSWQVGDVLALPYSDGSFSIVTSRYAFHHLENPIPVMTEMARVCAPDGRMVLADVYTPPEPERGAAYDRMEKLRDPSHVRALPLKELEELPRRAGLTHVRTRFYRLEMELEQVLQGSFPNPGDADKVRQLIFDDLDQNAMGLNARREDGAIFFAYPIAVIVASKPSNRSAVES